MSIPVFYGVNRLEASTVTAASTVTDRPLVRLSDRFIGPRWEGTAPIVWDQGNSPGQYDAVLGAPDHNLAGATLTVQTDDNSGFATPTTLGTLLVASSDAFIIDCSGSDPVERYSRLVVSGGPNPITLAELWASVSVTAPQAPLYPSAPNEVGNYVGYESEAGIWLAYIRSDPQWTADWEIPQFTRTVRDEFRTFFQAIGGGGRPFFVVDDEDEVRFCRWLNPSTTFGGWMPQKYVARFQLRAVTA